MLATAEGGPARKKRKKDRAEGSKDADASRAAAEAHAAGDQQGKKSGKKRRAGEARAGHAAAEPSAKKKKRAAPAAADAPAAAAEAAGNDGSGSEEARQRGGSGGDDDDADVADMRWKDNNNRVRVKSGPFSKAEKETLRKAGAKRGVRGRRRVERIESLPAPAALLPARHALRLCATQRWHLALPSPPCLRRSGNLCRRQRVQHGRPHLALHQQQARGDQGRLGQGGACTC